MRRVITRALGITVVLGGLIGAGAGVAAADPAPATGGDSAQQPCGAGDIDFAHGCFLGMGRFFK